MKITIVTGPFYPAPPAPCGAVERLWFDLALEFARRGHAVTFLCRGYPGQPNRETIGGVRFRRWGRLQRTRSTPVNLVKDFIYSGGMLADLPAGDVLLTNVFWLPVLARHLRADAGKLVVNVHRYPKRQIRMYASAPRIATCSNAVRDAIVQQLPSVAARVKVFPNPINTRVFTPPAPGAREASAPPTVVYTGRVDPEKGLDLLVRAFLILRRDRPDARLRIVGPWGVNQGGGGEDFKRSLVTRAAGAPVEFTGPIYDRPALADVLRSAHAYCYPSLAERGEALPIAPIEAMATGLVPVVSNLKCFRDYATEGETGFYFDHRSPDADRRLAAALSRVLAGGPEIQRIAARATAVAADFGTERVADRYLEDLVTLTAAPAPAPRAGGNGR